MNKLTALRWIGGKSVTSRTETGRWLADRLPYRRGYVEPFAGMLGVLLQRDASPVEVVNDIDGDIVNWWTQIRDANDELVSMFERTPVWSEAMWKMSPEKLANEDDPVWRAYWWTIRVAWSFGGNTRSIGREFAGGRRQTRMEGKLSSLRDRIKDIQIANEDAVCLLERVARRDDFVVYCDPPYDGTTTEYYSDNLDRERMTAGLLSQQGFCAVSGYANEWDHLGWNRYEIETASVLAERAGKEAGKRTEVVWSNQPMRAEPQGQLFSSAL